jgi:RND superfamily putative drug exporter
MSRIGRGAAWLLIALRVPIVVAWLAAAALAVAFLPSIGGSGASPLEDIVPKNAPALQETQRATQLFGAPTATDTVVVQRDPSGLSARAMRAHVRLARRALSGAQRRNGLLGAVPLANLPIPGLPWREHDTTALSYLFSSPGLSLGNRDYLAQQYAHGLVREGRIGVTGAAPARLAQFGVIQDALPWVTAATIALILLITFLYFRSLLAPLLTLGTAGLAYAIATHVLSWAAERLGTSVPQEIEPLLVVLLLGLVTDYSVFFLAEGRRRLLRGEERLPAARATVARVGPTVVVAGTIVAACCAALLAAKLEFFRVFGPGMAVCALIATAVAATFVPALLGLLGPRLYGRAVREAEAPRFTTDEQRAIAAPAPPPVGRRRTERLRRRLAPILGAVRAGRRTAMREGRSPIVPVLSRFMVARPVALVVAVVCIGGLGWVASRDVHLSLGVSYVRALPTSTQARSAADDASRGFLPGILAPAEILVEAPGVGQRRAALGRLQVELQRREQVSAVIGPALQLRRSPALLISKPGGAARYVLVMSGDPTAAPALDSLRSIRADMPRLLRSAGLPPTARVSYGGETALATDTVDAVKTDLKRIAIAVAIVSLLLLIVFLRALVAPFLLLAAGGLGYAGALGATALISRWVFGEDQLTYYVPLVALVLLVALGSDYNVLMTGRIRAEARHRRTREAIAVAAPQASRAITVAGLTLASSFALLAIVDLRPFKELAILLAVGVLIDALLVRPLLIPALLALLGQKAWWPARPIQKRPADEIAARVGQLAGVPTAQGGGITRAVLYVLGERVGGRQAGDLARHLPPEFAEVLEDPPGCEPFGYDEFIARVAQREGVDRAVAARDAGAVAACLIEIIPGTELDYLRAGLSEDYRPLFGDVPREAAVR